MDSGYRIARLHTLLMLLPFFAACSIVEPHPDLTDTLRGARLTGGVAIENPSRLTLPPMASIAVNHADGRTDNERLLAAQTGLSTYFAIAPADAPWQINVHWPDGAWEAVADSAEPSVDPSKADPGAPGSDTSPVLSTAAAALKTGAKGLRSAGAWAVRTADRDTVVVDVVQASTQTLVTRLRVDIEPWIRGRDWDDPVALTRTFMAVGAALSGS